MFEQRLKDIISQTYSGRILVFSNYTARQSLYAKGITPAIFLHKYYAQATDTRITYMVKEKGLRDMCKTYPIDAQELDCCKDEKINKIIRERVLAKSKLPKDISKEDLCSKLVIQNYLRGLNFFWFEQATRIYLYALSLDEGNFRLSTLQQPLGLAFLIEVQPGGNIRVQYEKVRKQADAKLKKIFTLNPSRVKNIPTFAIIFQNAEKGVTQAQAKANMQVLRTQYRFDTSLLCKTEINSPSAKDSIEWSSYPRVILKIDYKLQSSDPIRLINENEDSQLKHFVFNHRQKIRQYLEERLRFLAIRYEETNTAKNKFFNFFKGSSQQQRSYSAEESQSREIADLLFMLGDYKRSVDLYKDLAEKFEANERDQIIYYNICEMIQIGKCMHAFLGGNKIKTYQSIKNYAEKSMLKKSHGISKNKMYRYLLYIIYFLHGFRVFDKDFIKNSFYYYIKKAVNEETPSEQTPIPSVMPTLIHQQYANLDLLYPVPEYRRYGYDIVRVASKFNEFRLHDHHLRCLLIANYIYKDTFPIIQKYINSSLSRTYLQLKKYRFSLQRIQLSWKTLLSIYQDSPIPQNQQENQFSKLYSTQLRALAQIQRVQPQQLSRETEDCIPVPKISDIRLQVMDERLDSSQSLGSKWQDVGDVFLGQAELTSKGMSKQNMVKTLKMFDAITSEEKELAYRMKNMGNGPLSEAVIKRNARISFAQEPIIMSFCMKNPLPITIEITKIQLHLKVIRNCKITLLEPGSDRFTFKPGQKINVMFQIIPHQPGLYEFSHISWIFFKMTSIFRFKEPWETKSNLKSVYFKINVMDQCGQIDVNLRHGTKLLQGQETDLQIIMSNHGKQLIEDIYLAIDNENIFGFKLKRFQASIGPNETVNLKIKAQMPVLKNSDFLKCIAKLIFLYKTGGQFRVQRVVTCFNIQRVVEISNIKCQRISKSLHFLSFSLKYPSNQEQQQNILKSLVIKGGFQIKKVQRNRLDTLCHYFFFLRKNVKLVLEQFKFAPFQYSLQAVSKKFPQQAIDSDVINLTNSRINLLFLWWDKQGRSGIINSKPIQITASENEPNRIRLPFDVKVRFNSELECNFQQDMMMQVQVGFSIKNIFESKDINMILQFRDGQPNQYFWQGISQHHLNLKYNQEHRMKIKLLVFRAGIFNVARNIKYTIFINKSNSYSITHNDYQSIFLQIKQIKTNKQNVNFDFFQQYQVPSFKKTQKEDLNLI